MKKVALVIALLLGMSQGVFAGSPDPGVKTISVTGRTIVKHYKTFYGGEEARIAVVGLPGTNVVVYVYNQYGTLVGSTMGSGNVNSLSFRPLFTGTYTIHVVNREYSANIYSIATN
jgi:hypothetical protein